MCGLHDHSLTRLLMSRNGVFAMSSGTSIQHSLISQLLGLLVATLFAALATVAFAAFASSKAGAAPIVPVGYSPNGNCLGGTLLASPNASTSDNTLRGVAAISANDVWAVGHFVSSGTNRTFTMHWNGAQWDVVSSPNAGSSSNYLYAVVAISTNDVWAAGNYVGGSGPERTLIMHWDGAQWSIVPSPNSGPLSNTLRGLSASSASDVWAAG